MKNEGNKKPKANVIKVAEQIEELKFYVYDYGVQHHPTKILRLAWGYAQNTTLFDETCFTIVMPPELP